jgi:hypothetical protein
MDGQGSRVTAINSTDNNFFDDVIGNKNDSVNGNSIVSLLKIAAAYVHAQARVYPTLAGGVSVVCGTNPWTLGSFAVVIPANTIALPYIIDMVDVASLSVIDTYELVLYYGADGAEVEAGRIRFSRSTLNIAGPNRIQTEIIPANSQIKAKIASGIGSSETAIISFNYHVVNV